MRHLASFCLACAACAASVAPVSQPLAVAPTELAQADNAFGFSLLQRVREARPGENVFISPLSVAMCLQMTAAGAAGSTWSAMADALSLGRMESSTVNALNSVLRQDLVAADKRVRLTIANSLWANKRVKLQRQFADACRLSYAAEATTLDFASPRSVATINNWVATKTNGLIKSVISQLLPEELLVLVNAIYFKGAWSDAFNPKRTAAREFYLTPERTVQRQMMRRDADFGYLADEDFQAVSLPYGDGRLSMYLFVPDERDGLGDLMGRMTQSNWEQWMAGFREREGEVVLPRFKVEFEQSLVKQLKALGMAEALSPNADFSKMLVPPVTAAISDVIHKTFVEVNEQGTEAAAVTAVKMVATAMPSRDERFTLVADHPFFCAIRDNETGAILFMGTIADPAQ